MGCLPRSALFLVTESHSLTRSLNSFVLRESNWNWLKRKMKSRDARVKNEVLISERENNRRILGFKTAVVLSDANGKGQIPMCRCLFLEFDMTSHSTGCIDATESQHTMLIGVSVQGEWHHFGAEQKRKLKTSNRCPSFGAFICKKFCIHSANSLIHTQPTSMSKGPVSDVNSSDVHECDNQCNLRTPMSLCVPVSPCINNDNETMLRSTNIQMEYAVKDTSKGILGTTDLSNNCDNRLTQGTNMSVPNLCATPQCYQNSRRSPFTGKSRTCLHHLQCDHTDAIRYFRIIHEQQTWLVACNELKSRDDVKDVILTDAKTLKLNQGSGNIKSRSCSYVKRMIPELGDPDREVPVAETFHEQTDNELTKKNTECQKSEFESEWNGNVVAARDEGNGNGNANNDSVTNCSNCILMANLQQASTSGTQTNKVPVYDSDGLAEFLVWNNVGGTVEQHPVTVEETRAYFESLYNNLAIEVKKVNMVNRKMKETNVDFTPELARYKNQEKCFEINQEKYDN
ncbi:hypothetical protein Tco_0303627 [Tanacetum coccineum]